MKVGTDGVLLGALAGLPAAFESEKQRLGALPRQYAILDVGTGTGLVALMLAQRSSAQLAQRSFAPLWQGGSGTGAQRSSVPLGQGSSSTPGQGGSPTLGQGGSGTGAQRGSATLGQSGSVQVDAVEIVAEAAGQATENVAGSPWADRVRVIHKDFLDFYPSCRKKYDLIVSNPPYFQNSLKPAQAEKALARHGSTAFFRGLLKGSERLLAPSGKCCLILPAPAAPGVEAMAAEVNLYVQERVHIRSKPGEKIIRQLLTFGKTPPHLIAEIPNPVAGIPGPETETPHPVTERELVIYESEGQYSEGFAALVRPFYLNF